MLPLLLSAGLTPSSHPLLALNYLHQSILLQPPSSQPTDSSPKSTTITPVAEMSQNQLDELIRVASRSVFGFGRLLCEGHPVRAIALVELGKLLAVDEPEWVPQFSAGVRNDNVSTSLLPPSASLTSAASPTTATIDNSDGDDSGNSVTQGVGFPSANAQSFPPHGAARLKLSHDTLVVAHKELNICYGAATGGGKLGREIREMIPRLQQELAMWGRVRGALQGQEQAG